MMALSSPTTTQPCGATARIVLTSKNLSGAQSLGMQRLTNRRNTHVVISFPRRGAGSSRCSTEPEDKKVAVSSDESTGVKVAVAALKFYKREISPLLPGACRFQPTCSEYSMDAYKKYGVCKGTVLTAWRLCRCNPLGPSGFDPPVWFGEHKPTIEEILARPPRTSSIDTEQESSA
eukprot:CAMPEP_0118943612 /NCGR_PEP_ID=MMETSP1169-20130426/38692_1 /TAXON_ID=36882 /ORGANISM="Pyramimonas obovata, Strain CCMP722" /LENGTH=175 /DNA_ID=CAMNT_0006888907 /DNA_START=11 /DNA_END=535 /DNA_ORIENTATION=+